MYKRGTIVLVPFPFTDLSSAKVRPALIVQNNRLALDDVLLVFISSKKHPRISKHEFLLKKEHKDFSKTGLRQDSVFKLAKIATLHKKIILGELGRMSATVQKDIDDRLRYVFSL